MADYRGPIVFATGGERSHIWSEYRLRRDFYNKRATVSVNVTDVLNNRVFRVPTDDVAFSQERFFNRYAIHYL